MNSMWNLLKELEDETSRARAKHPNIHTPHEAYAVILEELDEYWDHVKADTALSYKARAELIQIAAMALRAIMDLKVGDASK